MQNNKFSGAKGILAIIAILVAIVFVSCLGSLFENVKNNQTVINQRPFSGEIQIWKSPGLVHICKECAKQHRSAGRNKTNEINDILRQLDEAKTMRLESFTPRELMLELKRRGYEDTLTYTETRTVNIANLN